MHRIERYGIERFGRGLRHGAAIVAVAALAAACSPADRVVRNKPYPFDHRDRHPIVLADGQRTLDVFTGRGIGGLDERQFEDVRSFGAEYAALGKGGIRALVPQGQEGHAHQTLHGIRRALAQSGLSGAPINIGYYAPRDPHAASPIRLSFVTLKAKVGSICGQWPADLGSGPSIAGWRNEPYWNHGCAVQSNIASQVADPLDFVRGRPEGRIDTLRRGSNIDKLRQARDPSTQYNAPAAQINQAVGN